MNLTRYWYASVMSQAKLVRIQWWNQPDVNFDASDFANDAR